MLALDSLNIAEQIDILEKVARFNVPRIGLPTDERLHNVCKLISKKIEILDTIKTQNGEIV